MRRITLPALVSAVAFSPDGRSLMVWDPAGYSTWDIASGKRQSREPVLGKACERVTTLPRSIDGSTIGVHCRNRLFLFDAVTAAPLGDWPVGENRQTSAFAAPKNGSVAAIVYAGALGIVELSEKSGAMSKSRLETGQEVETMAFSADGSRLTTGTFDGVQIWDLPSGTSDQSLAGGASHALSPDGRTVAIERSSGPALVDASSGTVRHTLKGPAAQLRFSPDGKLLVGWTNQQLAVWDTASGTPRLHLKAERIVLAAAAGDGSRIVTVSLDIRGERSVTMLSVWQLPAAQAGQ